MKDFSIFLALILVFAGCQESAKAPEIDQFASGEQLYGTYCASCHEVENGIGPLLTKEVVATRVNGQFLYNYNKRNMPYEAGNTLTEEQYWAITAYMLVRDGFLSEGTTLGPENAATTLLGEQ